MKNITFEGITLKGQHNVAPIGMDGRENANSVFEKITIKNVNIKGTGVYVSVLVGRKYGGRIKDCYVEGNLECHTTENGGISGATHQNILVENVISNVNINRPNCTDAQNRNRTWSYKSYTFQRWNMLHRSLRGPETSAQNNSAD